MKHHTLAWGELNPQFPIDGEFAGGMRPRQAIALQFVADNGSATIEMPPGEGKTAIEVTIARTAKKHFQRCYFVTPTKTVLEQIRQRFPDDFTVATGRNDFPCFYYERDKSNLTRDSKTKFRADEIPCSMLHSCPHRVDQETGEVHEKGAVPCPYLKQKYEAKISRKPVLATLAFYLYSRLFSKDFLEPDVLIIDEAHKVPETIRGALSYDITDWHLEKAIEVLEAVVDTDAAASLAHFKKRMTAMVRRKPARRGTLLEEKEIIELMSILETIDCRSIERSVARAIKEGTIDGEANMQVLKKVEGTLRNMQRYIRSLEFSLPAEKRGPLAYTYAYHVEEKGEHGRVENKLVVCSHHVSGLMKRLLGKTTITLSATIGNNVVFAQESGINLPFLSLPSSFPANNTAIFMPTDTPNLAFNERGQGDVTRVMRRIARAAKRLAKSGIRSLHVTVSNEEREKLVGIMAEEGVSAISYGNDVTAREAAIRFKDGECDVLIGTGTNFGEGVDLPRQIAPAIFVLRPAYPPPDDPRTQFEERRYGNNRWAIWNWRVMLAVLQVRGRNIRSEDDLGVTIFISQQFRRSVFASLPEALRTSYRGDFTLDQCVKETEKLVR